MLGNRVNLECAADQIGSELVRTVTRPGDYCGPVTGFWGNTDPNNPDSPPRPGVWFIPPIFEDIPGHPEAASLHSVCSPPHTFTTHPDGTLTIMRSIGCGPCGKYYWHGYLIKGVWCDENQRPIVVPKNRQ